MRRWLLAVGIALTALVAGAPVVQAEEVIPIPTLPSTKWASGGFSWGPDDPR